MAKSKPIRGIACDDTAASAMRAVITGRLDEMCALRDAALEWSDPEGVHDMRVASRRLRGALHDFSPYLRKVRLALLQKDIEVIAHDLGRVRDYDVAILELEKIAANAPPEVSHGINRCADFRRAGQSEARVKLMPALEHSFLTRVKAQTQESFERGFFVPSSRKKGATAKTYGDIARSVCLARLTELEKLSSSLYRPFTIKPLHRMRISAKHLRYALELFQDCLGSYAGQTAKKVARLQSALGGLHDCDIWIDDFGNSAQFQVPNLDFDLKQVSVWLINYFNKERGRHHRKALKLWLDWETEDVGNKLRNKLKGTAQPKRGR